MFIRVGDYLLDISKIQQVELVEEGINLLLANTHWENLPTDDPDDKGEYWLLLPKEVTHNHSLFSRFYHDEFYYDVTNIFTREPVMDSPQRILTPTKAVISKHAMLKGTLRG